MVVVDIDVLSVLGAMVVVEKADGADQVRWRKMLTIAYRHPHPTTGYQAIDYHQQRLSYLLGQIMACYHLYYYYCYYSIAYHYFYSYY